MILSHYNFLNNTYISNVGAFVYNTKTGAILCITDKESWEHILNNQFDKIDHNLYENLVKYGIIVPSRAEEFQTLKDNYYSRVNDNSTLTLTIMPTESCNFACPYCFQYEKKPTFMPIAVYAEIIKMINSKLDDNPETKKVIINWFGGEPSLCINQIFKFMDKLIQITDKKKIKIFSTITTNGYLVDDKVIKELVERKVTNIQITVDGDKNSHDKTRILKNGNGTYDVIMKNLKSIMSLPKEVKFEIAIRCNFTKNTVQSVKNFISIFADSFKNDSRFSIYCRPVYYFETKENEIKDMQNNLFSLSDGITAQNEFSNLICKKLDKQSLKRRLVNPLPQPTGCWCNAELKNFYIIGPNGELYICDTLTGKNNIRGYIFENNKATSMVDCRYDIFNDKRTEKCLACKILPICMSGCMRNRIYSNAQCYWTEESISKVFSDFITQNYSGIPKRR